MRTGQRKSLEEYTERAIRATESGTLIPPLVYIPMRMRARLARTMEDGVTVTTNPATVEENNLRVANADPVGMLIAMMQGQPIPSFEIRAGKQPGELAVFTNFMVADIPLRAEIAMKLVAMQRRIPRTDAEAAQYEAMIKRASEDV